jgi:hypothetical protein
MTDRLPFGQTTLQTILKEKNGFSAVITGEERGGNRKS